MDSMEFDFSSIGGYELLGIVAGLYIFKSAVSALFGGGSVKYPCSKKNLKLTVDELSQYDGSSAKSPLLVSCKCIIYDVGQGKEFYAPGRVYGWMAGRDVTVALAKFSGDRKYVNCTWGSLSDPEADLLNKWEQWLQVKYPAVGTLSTAGLKTCPSTTDTSFSVSHGHAIHKVASKSK